VSPCEKLERFLENRLSGQEAFEFEAHLATCAECAKSVRDWQAVRGRFADWTRAQEPMSDADVPSPQAFSAAISQRLNAQRGIGSSRRRTVAIYSAVAAAAVAVIAVGYFSQNSPKNNERISVSHPRISAPVVVSVSRFSSDGQSETSQPVAVGDTISSGSDGRALIRLKSDLVGLEKDSAVVVETISNARVSLRLEKGSVACAVHKRSGGAQFIVEAGVLRVTVVGTRFSVARGADETTVAVDEGIVKVSLNKKEQLLSAGESMAVTASLGAPAAMSSDARHLMNRLLSMDAAPLLPIEESKDARALYRVRDEEPSGVVNTGDMDSWRKLILEGQLAEAEEALTVHLKQTSKDVDARMLLATCQKKAGHPQQAIASYDEVILSGGSVANRARYLAGEISQEQLNDAGAAARYFSDYLENAPLSAANRPDARLRLARALFKLDRAKEARAILNALISEYGATPAAQSARKMLEQSP